MHDLNELAFFACVAESGSFTQAAKKLGMPKSTLSRRVSQLEQRLGVRLLHRTTRQLKLTEIGLQYLQRCQCMMQQADEAEQLIQTLQEQPSGKLRIATPLSFGTDFFQQLIADFSRHYPSVQIEILMGDKTPDLIDKDIDVAFSIGQPNNSNLVARNLGSARWIFCATPNYLDQYGIPTQPQELYPHRLIRHPQAPLTVLIEGQQQNIDVPNQLLINDISMVKDMTLRGLGIGLVHTLLIEQELALQQLAPLLLDTPCRQHTVYLVFPSRRHLTSKVSVFVDFVLQRVGPIAPWQQAIKTGKKG